MRKKEEGRRKKEEEKGRKGMWKDVEEKGESEKDEKGVWMWGKSEWQVGDVGNGKDKIRKQEVAWMLRNILDDSPAAVRVILLWSIEPESINLIITLFMGCIIGEYLGKL